MIICIMGKGRKNFNNFVVVISGYQWLSADLQQTILCAIMLLFKLARGDCDETTISLLWRPYFAQKGSPY
jgi:hypothetical protein